MVKWSMVWDGDAVGNWVGTESDVLNEKPLENTKMQPNVK